MPKKKILVIDDDPDIVVYLSSLLEDHGYELQSAGDSAQALAVLERFEPDVILIDVMMPGRSGLDLLVRLRQDARWKDKRMVVVTGNDRILEDDCQSYVGSHADVRGPDGVLGKPVDPPTLLAVLRTLTAEQ